MRAFSSGVSRQWCAICCGSTSVIRCVKERAFWCIIIIMSKALRCGAVVQPTDESKIGKGLRWYESRPDAPKDFRAFLAGEIASESDRCQCRPHARGGEPPGAGGRNDDRRPSPRTWG